MNEYTEEFRSRQAGDNQKHILIFLDGTWNDEDGVEENGVTTNIYRLFRSVSGNFHEHELPQRIESDEQVALYFRGVGNDEENSKLGTWYGGVFGAGERRIRDHAYAELVNHYASGDRICIFGFSRGAACARLLAAKIHRHGIAGELTAVFKDRQNGEITERYFLRYEGASEGHRQVAVDFLGLFDTVGAFGVPVDLGFFKLQKLNLFRDLSVADNVQRVVHCVSIDESRDAFTPTLCDRDDRVEEVWFPGVHSDVGGGYRLHELGKISLNFMVERLQQYFAQNPVEFAADELQRHTRVDLFNERVHLHYHGEGLKRSLRDIYVSRDGKRSQYPPKIHRSVVDLRDSEQLHLVEETGSFVRLTPVLYMPSNLDKLPLEYEIID